MADTELPYKLSSPIKIKEFLAQEEQPYDWLIPGLLERGDRFILTGGEGMGKSTLLRQMAIQIAAGIHPFTHEKIPARRVLFIDLENPTRILRRKMQEIIGDTEIVDGNLKVAAWPTGIDLREGLARQLFSTMVREELPDILFIGPIYKMWDGSLESDEESKALAKYLDRLRADWNPCLFIEAHQPHASVAAGKKDRRPPRPIGSSLWIRWPEFGYCLFDGGELVPWRGARDERDWPKKLKKHGETWPWEIANEKMGPEFCIKCGEEIPETYASDTYCSKKCGDAYRKAEQRKRSAGVT